MRRGMRSTWRLVPNSRPQPPSGCHLLLRRRILGCNRQREPGAQKDFRRLAALGGLEMDVDGARLVERPDLAEIGSSHGIGGIELAVAGWNLEPVPDLKRPQPGIARRRFRAHDEDVGVKARIGGEQVLLRGRADSARPEKRLAARMEEEHQRAVLGAAFGAVGSGIENVDPNAGTELKTPTPLP